MANSKESDLAREAEEAKLAGFAEVVALLQHPEDLAKLPDLVTEYNNRLRAAKATLSSLVQSQVEAVRHGVDLLARAHRHAAKLQAALDKINSLCAECAALVDRADVIKQLALAHSNVQRLLTEIEGIVDLPYRADRCEEMVEEDVSHIVPAFEALVVLVGTANNARQAWERNAKAKAELGELQSYLARVDDVMSRFEERIFSTLRGFIQISIERPTLLVDCVRVMELQEAMDKQYTKVKMGYKPKAYKDRFIAELVRSTDARFEGLVDFARTCGTPNKKVKYDQDGDPVIAEERDKAGGLSRVVLLKGGESLDIRDMEELKAITVIEEFIFDEQRFLNELLTMLGAAEQDLAACYDYAAPCFPPHWNIFDRVFQMYHVHFATVVDVLGKDCEHLSINSCLRVMQWVAQYMSTLRNLGIEEDLVKLPISPQADPEDLPGMVVLMGAYIDRMETTVQQWYTNIIQADLKGGPKQNALTGASFTPGCIDFFRILSEEMAVIEGINDHGEVMYKTAECALKTMGGFQAAQQVVLASGRPEISSLEMLLAIANNNINAYEQSLEFVEGVQAQLEEQYRDRLDVEPVCRGFLDTAKDALGRAVKVIFNDQGLSTHLLNMYSTVSGSEWLRGQTMATLLATLADYFTDLTTWLEPPLVKRAAEAMLNEMVRRIGNMFVAGPPQAGESVLLRMSADEQEITAWFMTHLRPDKLAKPLAQLGAMRALLETESGEEFAASCLEVLEGHPSWPLDAALKIITNCRQGLDKKKANELTAAAKGLWKKTSGKGAPEQESGWGWFSGKK